MANRFLETNYYKSPFVRGLQGSLKALYSFIICDCSSAGIWNKDLEAASLYIGFPITDEQFQEAFVLTEKAIDIGRGKYFFPDFIEHQYPKGLQDSNVAHRNIIFELKKLNLIDEKLLTKRSGHKDPSKTLTRVISNGNGKGNGKEMVKVKVAEDVPEKSKLWFLQYFHSDYSFYKSKFNGQSTTEVKFLEWKKFIDFIYLNRFEELFECKFLSPHDYAKLDGFTPDKWDAVLKRILATGIKPEHNLFFRIPEFIKYGIRKSTTDKASSGNIGKTIEFDRP